MKNHIFSANDHLIFTNDRMQLGSVTFSHDRLHYQDRILYMIVFFITKSNTHYARDLINYGQSYMFPVLIYQQFSFLI